MRKTLVGVTSTEMMPLLSDMAFVVLNDSEFEIWKDKDSGLYSVSVGWDIRFWSVMDVTLEGLNHFLVCQIPFYDEEVSG